MTINTIHPQALADLSREGYKPELIDVRTPMEYREVHVALARNVPLDALDPAAIMQARNGSKDEPLYLICRSGSRGRQACERFVLVHGAGNRDIALC
ncbi:MAG: rhodanese-like domain-containing protein [Planctomycetes bacterium]|nr:rhodanese-like domain-containing protein [Planctomycetota bacterium]